MEIPKKHCESCNETKYRYEFGQRTICFDGLSKYCKECIREKKKIARQKSLGFANPNPADFRNFNIKRKK